MFHRKLKNARLAAGLSQDQTISQLKEHGIEITKAALSYYENGKRTPDASMVRELAHTYGTGVGRFLSDESDFQIDWYSYRASDHRLGTRKKEAIVAFAQEQAYRLVQIYKLVPSFRADFPKRKAVRTYQDADSVAVQLRRHWKLGLDAIESVTGCFENHGVMVIHYDGEPTSAFDGLSALVNRQFPLLIINSNVPVDRLRFDLAHELGHVLMDTSVLENDKEEEKIVHRFASSFLVPPEIVKKELGDNRRNMTSGELIMLKEKYGLSLAAWIYSAWANGVINRPLYETLCKTLSARGWRKMEPEVFKGNEKPGKLRQVVLRLVAEEAITVEKVVELFPALKQVLMKEGFGIKTDPGHLRKMASAERSKILEKAAEEAAEDYRTDKSLRGFEENDFHEYE